MPRRAPAGSIRPKRVTKTRSICAREIPRPSTALAPSLFTAAEPRRRSHFSTPRSAKIRSTAPALLNMAVIHQSQNNRQQALDQLKQYASLAPLAPNIDAVHITIEQLESELNPTPPAVSGIALPKTNTLVHTPPRTTSAPPAIVSAPRTNPPSIAAQPRTRTTPTNPPAVAARPAPATNRAEKPPDVPVTRLEDDLLVTPPQDLATLRDRRTKQPQPRQPLQPTSRPPTPTTLAKTSAACSRASIPSLDALNLRPPTLRLRPTSRRRPRQISALLLCPPRPRRFTRAIATPRRDFRRPATVATPNGTLPAAWPPKNRPSTNQALGYYQQAVDADPAYFDAYYNLGLAAYDTGRWKHPYPRTNLQLHSNPSPSIHATTLLSPSSKPAIPWIPSKNSNKS